MQVIAWRLSSLPLLLPAINNQCLINLELTVRKRTPFSWIGITVNPYRKQVPTVTFFMIRTLWVTWLNDLTRRSLRQISFVLNFSEKFFVFWEGLC